MSAARPWEIYVIHHAHTDIGYTERQDKIMRYHYDFIRQAIHILDGIHATPGSPYEGFRWQCENYWQVENFYARASEAEKRSFERYVGTGEIGLSGNYLNLTELVSQRVLDHSLAQMEAFGKSIGHPITAGMSADINGFSWGYADALYDHGVREFFSCLHPHHGMFPLYRKVQPFYWETPKGNRLLVWNGEHYHFGNELFLSPHAGSTYLLHDEFRWPHFGNMILNKSAEDTEETEVAIARTRLERYLSNLADEGCAHRIVPFMVSGVSSDNAPPSREVARRLKTLNELFDGRIVLKMATLEEFFDRVKQEWTDIPVYRGDWTDWWADGVGSTPAETKLCRGAIRRYDLCEKLDPEGKLGSRERMDRAAKDIMLYAEHTWGYSSSISEPWDSRVALLDLRKTAYGVNADVEASENLDAILAAKGEISIAQDMPPRYKIINPHGQRLHTSMPLSLEYWEYLDGCHVDPSMPVRVVDEQTGKVLPSQVHATARAAMITVEADLLPHEERLVRVERDRKKPDTIRNHAHIGADGIEDILGAEKGPRTDTDRIETEDFILTMEDEKGIASLVSRKDGRELLRRDLPGAFTGVYQITDIEPIENGVCETRRKMGRNRRSLSTRSYAARLKDRRIVENGPVKCVVHLDYALEGTRMYRLVVEMYKHLPKIDVLVQIHKESRLEPENLYAALPFGSQDDMLYLDKTGCIIRPGLDQLPGSNQEFYLLQNALVWQHQNSAVCVLSKDVPLVTLGDLGSHPIRLCSGQDEERNHAPVWSWIMNNFWETNFRADLGGFYEFSYTILLDDSGDIRETFQRCEDENEGLLSCFTRP